MITAAVPIITNNVCRNIWWFSSNQNISTNRNTLHRADMDRILKLKVRICHRYLLTSCNTDRDASVTCLNS